MTDPVKPIDRKTQEPIRAVGAVCRYDRLHNEPGYPLVYTSAYAVRDAWEFANTLDSGLNKLSACGPHRVVELREVRDGGE